MEPGHVDSRILGFLVVRTGAVDWDSWVGKTEGPTRMSARAQKAISRGLHIEHIENRLQITEEPESIPMADYLGSCCHVMSALSKIVPAQMEMVEHGFRVPAADGGSKVVHNPCFERRCPAESVDRTKLCAEVKDAPSEHTFTDILTDVKDRNGDFGVLLSNWKQDPSRLRPSTLKMRISQNRQSTTRERGSLRPSARASATGCRISSLWLFFLTCCFGSLSGVVGQLNY